ncbi:MAG: YkgJ family cysteine cluster protein [Myxococcota bacterium]
MTAARGSDTDPDRPLEGIYDAIARRVKVIADERAPWPCRRGCDQCCRRLAELPELTRAEWRRLWRGLERLDDAVIQQVRARLARVGEERSPEGYHTCPFLDREHGACLVYEDRPAACRMYGFYVSRGDGRWCQIIEGEYGQSEIMWGNHDAVERDLNARFGPPISLLDWLAESGI